MEASRACEAGCSSPTSSVPSPAPSFPSPSSAAASKQTFAMLQPLCSRLLELPLRRGQSDYSDTSLLVSLRQTLCDCPPQGLRVCLDYVLFPLQLLLDASVACRLPHRSTEAENTPPVLQFDSGDPQKLYIVDKIAEGVLLCLEELLFRCPLTTTTQMSVLLRKLTAAAMLSPDEASEEFRHAAVKCLKRLFTGLQSCRGSFCSCKLSALPLGNISDEGCLKADIISTISFSSRDKSKEEVEEGISDSQEECLITFLQSENMATAVGHLLSLFLQISEKEASIGRIGSANLRIDAILTLRVLLLKIGAADALAFFLPGVTSRLVKSLQSSKRMNTGLSELSYPSGAAGSSGAAEQAVRALSELLALVLADERNRDTLELNSQLNRSHTSSVTLEGNQFSAEAALAAIRKGSYSLEESNTGMVPSECDGRFAAGVSRGSNILQNAIAESAINTFRVHRNKSWLEHSVKQISTLLALCFPALCRHPAPFVRLAAAESAFMLMSTCRVTLEGFMPTLLESLLAIACDDWPHVASTAHECLMSLMTEQHDSSGVLRNLKSGLKQIILRLLERLPKAMFSGDESVGLFFCRQLLAAMFFAGPEGVSECVFQSSVATKQFVTVMVQCFSFNSAFAGSLQQLNITNKGSLGYIPGIVELGSDKVVQSEHTNLLTVDSTNMPSEISSSGEKKLRTITVTGKSELQQLPRKPPWFRQSGGCKVYPELAGILRLVGLSSMFGSGDARNLFVLIEELMDPLRCPPFGIQGEMYEDQFLVGNGQWQRRAATSVSVLNEILYGASGLWIYISCLPFEGPDRFKNKIFAKMVDQENVGDAEHIGGSHPPSGWYPWEDLAQGLTPEYLGDCVGDILHEYTSDTIWKLPVHAALDIFNAPISAHGHILKDNSFLQQVIIEGIGVLALLIGKLFEEQGFLGSVLYLLLERLGCADYYVSNTADLVLHAVSSACGFLSVRALVVASTDYIVDSLCRQLRHMDLFPNAPNMLVAVLRYTGAGQDLVPLLQEPMRSISLELEIPARRGHPGNTLPMLRALSEIVKAAKGESVCMLERTLVGKESDIGEQSDDNTTVSHWDEITSILKESERIRQSLQDIVILCLNSSSPLMASKDQNKCLLALEIVETGVAALACMDAVAKHEKKERAKARGHLEDISDFNEAEPPKLLPTMHRVWPHLAACLKHNTPSVLVQSSKVIASVVSSCGGDFFTRRFHQDVLPRFSTILCQGTGLQPKSEIGKYGDRKMLPNLQGNSVSIYKEFAPASLFKVQEAVLACISDVGKSKKSASALVSSLEQLAAVVVGLACGVPGLHDYATQTLLALSNIDADLVWILVADVAYGGDRSKAREVTLPGPMFPEACQLLPPFLASQEEALWKQLSGKDLTSKVDTSKAWTILSKLESCELKYSRSLDID